MRLKTDYEALFVPLLLLLLLTLLPYYQYTITGINSNTAVSMNQNLMIVNEHKPNMVLWQ